MPNIRITDGFGLDLEASLDPKSGFAKYFQAPPNLSVVQKDLASLQDVPLLGFPLKSTEIGLTYTQPAAIASDSPQFAGSASVAATLRVVADGKLFDPDPFASPIDVPSGHAYLGLGVKASVAPGVTLPSGKLAFGFAAGSTLCMSHYRSFVVTPTTPTFKSALQESLQNYVVPFRPDDFAVLGVGDVALFEGTGSLQLSATINLLTSVNPLVSVSSAALPGTLEIQECAKVDIKACCTITGDLQIRIQRVDTATIRLGFYRKRGAELTVQADPAVGISAGTSNTDFISVVLGAIGPDPLPPAAQLASAGLTKEKQEVIASAIKAAIQRRIELSLQAEIQALASQEAAFLYEIHLDELGPENTAPIQNALRLNLSGLSESPLPAGIREIQSVLTTTKTKGLTLKINALGIYNYTSKSDLTLKGTVLADPASGEILITDAATASRVSGAVNFLADGDKLRKVLAQSFLVTAAYRCSGLIAHAPSLKVSYWHFAESAKTGLSTMAAYLRILAALGLISATQERQSLAAPHDFGRSTLYLNTEYDDALSEALFLGHDGQPRAIEEYEEIGRDALRQLIPPDGEDAFRLEALNVAIWPQVKEAGGTAVNLTQVFPALNTDSQIPIIAGDYVVIEWWATTMARMAQSLSAAKRFFSQVPAPPKDSPAAQKAQADLWRQMADVASNTHDRFSDPWGLLAMDLASGRQSAASARLLSTGLTLLVERPKAP